MPQKVAEQAQNTVRLTDAAVAAVRRLLAKEGCTPAQLGLRVRVGAGGCAGLRYQLYFDDLPPGAVPPVTADHHTDVADD